MDLFHCYIYIYPNCSNFLAQLLLEDLDIHLCI